MTRYVFRRLGGAIIILWVIITVTFALMHAIPGGPFTTEKKLPPQVKASIEAKYHLDDPVWKQYGDYLGGVITGDLGPSFKYEGRSVNDIISDAFPISAQLGLLSLMVAVVGGITAGAISAMRPNSIVDYAVTVLSTLGISVPTFIIGAVLVYVVGFELGWFPVALWRGPSYMVLPVFNIGCTTDGIHCSFNAQWLIRCVSTRIYSYCSCERLRVLDYFDASCTRECDFTSYYVFRPIGGEPLNR